MRKSAAPTDAGFTLLEVLLSLLILAVIAAVLSQILQGSLRQDQILRQAEQTEHVRQREINRQFSGEAEEPILEWTPVQESPE